MNSLFFDAIDKFDFRFTNHAEMEEKKTEEACSKLFPLLRKKKTTKIKTNHINDHKNIQKISTSQS